MQTIQFIAAFCLLLVQGLWLNNDRAFEAIRGSNDFALIRRSAYGQRNCQNSECGVKGEQERNPSLPVYPGKRTAYRRKQERPKKSNPPAAAEGDQEAENPPPSGANTKKPHKCDPEKRKHIKSPSSTSDDKDNDTINDDEASDFSDDE
ncbi:hypothetical protein DSO57_1039099 [Entomophthora muscae]|uniref:Uncharacterized protein n=3 Tax=Entomophthora muscae TaxID=34485 RepID=A0ACC2U7J6_9FUNG|nr:hypothetical protein DSO57_1002182 [Entomophthora muscae]KAJ9070967.1 hypothetical protein DSO57_1002183 [Entomophthora muscae]KAJ9083003.1 hypothetical protein DSO57_1039099 [Entomophthora muscae]